MKLRLPPRLLSEVDGKGRPLPPRRPGKTGSLSDAPKFPVWRFLFGIVFIGVLAYDMVQGSVRVSIHETN